MAVGVYGSGEYCSFEMIMRRMKLKGFVRREFCGGGEIRGRGRENIAGFVPVRPPSTKTTVSVVSRTKPGKFGGRSW